MHDFGYRLDRIRGSHAYFIHSKYPNICVPKHEPIKVAYIKSIIQVLKAQEETTRLTIQCAYTLSKP